MDNNNFNIQDGYFAKLRRDKTVTTIYLVNGVKLIGKIKSFDKFAILIENNHQEQLIFKHAISTITYNNRSGYSRPSYPPQAGANNQGSRNYDRYNESGGDGGSDSRRGYDRDRDSDDNR